jgi:spore maturation protein CgeB
VRIFLAISPESTPGVKKSNTWLYSLYEPLVDIGHEVHLFRNDLAIEKVKKNKYFGTFDKSLFSEILLKDFLKAHNKDAFDVFLSYVLDRTIDIDCIDTIKRHGVVTMNYSCNNTHQFYLIKQISPHFDYNLHSEKNCKSKFVDIGAKPIWFPMAANPTYYKPYNLPRNIDVSFVGRLYAKRPLYIRHLLANNIDVKVYGPGWKKKAFTVEEELLRMKMALRALFAGNNNERARLSGWLFQHDLYKQISLKYDGNFFGPCSDEEMVKLYSKSKISLGFVEVYDRNSPEKLVSSHVHLREFEAPMSRALYCTGFTKEILDFYEPDKEILVYYNEEDMLDKIAFYLKHESNGNRIRENGYRRATSCHTYQKRFANLFAELKYL